MFTIAALRTFTLFAPSGVPELRVLAFRGEEAISRLYRYELKVSSQVPLSFPDILGRQFTLRLMAASGSQRDIQGLVTWIRELGTDDHDQFRYRMELAPLAYPLTHAVRSRIFQNISGKGILEEVLHGTIPFVMYCDAAVESRSRPYCVQYFESDMAFATRLAEEEGYFFFFDESGMRIGNSVLAYTSQMPNPVIQFDEVTGRSAESIFRWRKKRRMCTQMYKVRDHNFQLGSPVLQGSASMGTIAADAVGWEPLQASWSPETSAYPGNYAHFFEGVGNSGTDQSNLSGYIPFGDWRASAELMQSSGSASVIEAVSNCRGLFPGGKFTLAGHGTADGEYLVISVRQEGTQAVDHSSGQTQRFSFRNRFECVPFASAPFFRQPRITRKPAVHGCQTALVIGPNGEEIWTDKYGRVRVQFPWDTGTLGSCWVRVGTSWAGSQWGSLHVPRVGQEVIVSFLDGDPDRPIVVGSVYNANMMPRYDLPSEKSLSGLVSRSTPGGSQATFNEIRFDDTKGSEQIVVHAQKDQFEVVENNSHRIVGNDDMSDIGGNQSANVAGNRHEKIGGVFSLEATDEIHLKAKKIVIEAESISLRTPGGGSDEFLYLEKGGGITIDSKGNHVWLNCGGAGSPDDGTAANPTAPTDPYATGSQG